MITSFLKKIWHVFIVLAVLVAAWHFSVAYFKPYSFLVPTPMAVFDVFLTKYAYLFFNAVITMWEMTLGLIIGSLVGIFIALVLSQFPILDRYLMPIVTLMPNLPVFAIAPILVVWFGFGISSKIIMTTLIILFPVASSFYDGLKSTPTTYVDMGKSWGASRWQMLWHTRVPAALPSLMSGLKIAATIAPIGAIVGEWVGAAGGLGFVIVQANARTQIDVVFAALVLVAFSAFMLRWIVVLCADRFVWWSDARV